MWDTAGQERFKSISQAYYRNANGCIAVYDVTQRASFEAISEYITSFIDFAPPNSARNIVLVGNKTDLEAKRQVSLSEAILLARKLGLAACLETSAKSSAE